MSSSDWLPWPAASWHFLAASEACTAAFAGLPGIRYWYYGEHLMHDFRILRPDGEGRVLKARMPTTRNRRICSAELNIRVIL